MLEIDYNYLFLKNKLFLFSDEIFDVDGCDNVIFCHYDNDVPAKHYEKIGALTSTINLSQGVDQLWNNLKSKTRQKIHKAEKLGIEVKINADYNKFCKLYKNFTAQKGIKIPFKNDIPSFNFIKDNGFIITSYHNDSLLGGIIVFNDENSAFIQRMASNRLVPDEELSNVYTCQNSLLVWETMQHLKNIGVQEWDWGGLWSSDVIKLDPSKEGTNIFKLSFGAKEKQTWNYVKWSKKYHYCSTLIQYLI
jgi:hypothetical protein